MVLSTWKAVREEACVTQQPTLCSIIGIDIDQCSGIDQFIGTQWVN